MMRGHVTIWPKLLDTIGRSQPIPWPELFDQFEHRIDFEGDNHAGWSPAEFEGGKRLLEAVERVHALVLDVDGGWSIPGAVEAFGDLYGLIHTSKSHTYEVHRFRVILPFKRPVSAFEYSAIWRRFDLRWPARLDHKAKDPSRFWYLPGVLGDEAPFETVRLDGEPLDPDKVLSEPEPQAAPVHTPSGPDDERVERRALAYVATMPAAISGSGGHEAIWRVACVLARGFGLQEHRVLDILRSEYNPRCQPAWSERELCHKARQAVSNSRMPFGYLLEDDTRALPPDAAPPSPDWGAAEETPTPQAPADSGVREPGDDSAEEMHGGDRPPAWQRHGVKTMREIFFTIQGRCLVSKKAPSVSTGNRQIDLVIGGYRPGKITVMGAQTNFGKSTWAIMALDDGIRCGKRILLVSGEDDEITYGKRLLARRSGLSALRLRDEVFEGDEARQDLAMIAQEVGRAEDAPWFLDGRGVPAEKLARVIEEVAVEGEYDLVIVDYLQSFHLANRAQDRRNELTTISRLFTNAIKKAPTAAGLLLSQIKRLESANREPTKHDLKESGDIENSADHVILGWIDSKSRPPEDAFDDGVKWDRVMKVDKNKDGPQETRAIQVPFHDKTASFRRTAPWPTREDLH